MVAVEELRGMGESEITDRVDDLREQLFKLRFQKTTGLVESANRLRGVRRELARALTVQREREIVGPKPAATVAATE